MPIEGVKRKKLSIGRFVDLDGPGDGLWVVSDRLDGDLERNRGLALLIDQVARLFRRGFRVDDLAVDLDSVVALLNLARLRILGDRYVYGNGDWVRGL